MRQEQFALQCVIQYVLPGAILGVGGYFFTAYTVDTYSWRSFVFVFTVIYKQAPAEFCFVCFFLGPGTKCYLNSVLAEGQRSLKMRRHKSAGQTDLTEIETTDYL